MSQPSLSVAFTTDSRSPEHIRIAEELGYARAWLYDIPHQGTDVWLALHLAAQRTSRIGLGPGVLIPTLRHPIVNAGQTATLAKAAPGRVAVAFGTGFSSRAALGQRPIPWSYVARYVTAYRDLLRGKATQWEGVDIRLLPIDQDEFGLPVEVSVLLSALGPKGAEHARQLGVQGIFGVGRQPPIAKEYPWSVVVLAGTVLAEDESADSDRVRAAAAPTSVGVTYHFTHATRGLDAVRALPGGQAWAEIIAQQPADQQHLYVHQGHLARLNPADEAAWNSGGGALLTKTTFTAPAAEVRARVEALAAQGVTEVVYQPSGPDISGEIERFIAAVRAPVGRDGSATIGRPE